MLSGRRMTFARLGSQRVVIAAASVTILLATVLLTALWVYIDAAATVGVRAVIAASSESDTGLSIRTSTTDATTLDPLDALVDQALDAAFAAVPYDIASRYTSSDAYTLPTAGDGPTGDPIDNPAGETGDELTSLAWYDQLSEHATVRAGVWPMPSVDTSAPVEVALHIDAAAALGLAPGDTFTVVNRLEETPLELRLAGTFEPTDPASWYWRADPLDTTGFAAGVTFATRGPLLVADRATFVAAIGGRGVGTEWHVGPRWELVSPGSVEPTRAAVSALERDLPTTPGMPPATVNVETGLDEILTTAQRGLVSNRSMMIVPLLQLAVLAAYTLLLAARLMSEHRRGESALLRARGMSRRQQAVLAVTETAVLVVPAAVVAPLAAVALLRLVSGRGPFGALGTVADRPTLGWWVVSGGAALLCGLALVLPSLRSGDTYVATQAARGRSSRRGVLQRAGVDVLLLGGAVLAYVQLRQYESPVLAAGPAPQIDPLLVLGPCLALLAGAAISLRLLTIVASMSQRVAARGRFLGATLGAWQVARRPLRYSGPTLLLVLALAIGAMSTAYAASWRLSQRDQAVFAAGADVRLTMSTAAQALGARDQASVVAALPGVERAAAARRDAVTVGDTTVDLLALDAAEGASVVELRGDLSAEPVDSLLAPLAAGRWEVPGILVPGEPRALTLTVTADAVPSRAVDLLPGALVPGSVSLAIRDRTGTTMRLDPVPVRFDGTVQELTVDLAGPSGATDDHAGAEPANDTASHQPAYPLTIIGARIVMATPPAFGAGETLLDFEDFVPVRSSLVISGLAADGVPVEPGAVERPDWSASSLAFSYFETAPSSAPGDGLLAAEVQTMLGGTVVQTVDVAAGAPGDELRAIMDRTAADAAGVAEGGSVQVRLGAEATTVTVLDVVSAFPGTDPTSGVLVIDYPTLTAARWLDSGVTTSPTEWWLASSDPAATVDAARREGGLTSAVVSAEALTAAYGDDPLGAMTLGALLAGFVAALAFAAVGVGVNLVIGARERLSEFAVLRALGVSRRQVLTTLLVEQAFLVGLGVCVGVLVGLLVSVLVVPLVLISPRSARVFPPVLVDVPWLLLAATTAGVVTLLGLLVAVAAGRMQRQELAGTLRLGDEW